MKSPLGGTSHSERRRGGQPGARGHGRTPRPALDEREEVHNPPPDARVCACCGKPYVANGARVSSLVEIEVSAHKRVIHRPRWRRGCVCASSPVEVSAPPVPRLFAGTSFGTSVWARFLFERYACFRPLRRVAAWLSDQGLPVSAGTLGDSMHRFTPMFDPVAAAILSRQNEAALRHGDETTWRVQSLIEEGRSSRAWLWTSVSTDSVYFHVDPSRSAEVALKLFGGAGRHTVLVCDRYSAYKKLARELDGAVILAFCWSHQRRTYVDAPRITSMVLNSSAQSGQAHSYVRPLDCGASHAAGPYGDAKDRVHIDYASLSSPFSPWFSRSRLDDRLPLRYPPTCLHSSRLYSPAAQMTGAGSL